MMNHRPARRQFLIQTAALAGATFFDVPAILQAAGVADSKDSYGGFPMGVQSFSLRNFNTLEAIRHLQGMQLHYVEFFRKHLDPMATDEEIAQVKKLLAEAAITMSAHGVNAFTKDHEANERIFRFAKHAGLRNITANPQPDAFDSLEQLVAKYDIRIAIHNHGPGALYDTIASVKQAIQDRHPHIGACVDTGHFIRSNEDPVKAVYELAGRVYGVHVKDDQHRGQKKSHNVVIGKANLDVVGLFRALRDTRFPADGALSLEYEANPDNPIDDMKQCLVVAQQAIAQLG